MIAGLGLSGDLKDPKRSIPMGTIGATLAGMLIYSLVAIKLAQSATPEALAEDQFIMARIALWGPSIYIGLAAAAFSSALGSVMVAPRTLQALARDRVFPVAKFNTLLASGRGEANEPVNATYMSVALAAVFVALGDIDFIAQILSMFFMVTYGTLCVGVVPGVLCGQPVVQADLSLPLVHFAGRCGHVRAHDGPDERPVCTPSPWRSCWGSIWV